MLISILLLFLLGCSYNSHERSEKEKSKQIQLSNEERKSLVFSKLKDGKYSEAVNYAIDIEHEDNFYLLLQGLSNFGVDSLIPAKLKFEILHLRDTNSCNATIAAEFLDLMNDKNLDREFRNFYLSSFLNKLEFENIERICELYNDTTTYDVEVYIDIE